MSPAAAIVGTLPAEAGAKHSRRPPAASALSGLPTSAPAEGLEDAGWADPVDAEPVLPAA